MKNLFLSLLIIATCLLISFDSFTQINNGNFDDNFMADGSWTLNGGGGYISPPGMAVLIPAFPATNPSTLSQDFDCLTPANGNCWVNFEVLEHTNVIASVNLGGVIAIIPGIGKYNIKHVGCGPLNITFTATRLAAGDPSPQLHIDNVQDICTLANISPFSSTDITPPISCEAIPSFCFNINASTATFTNNALGNGTLSYLWDFGDGNTSTAMNPNHIYTGFGTYNTCLTITNTLSDGTVCCYTCCEEINIFPPCHDNIPGPTFNYLYKNNGSIKFNNPSGAGGAFTKEWTIDGVLHSNLNQPPSITLNSGFHLVCLEVTKNSNPNCSEKFCRNIWIDEACTVPTSAKVVYESCLNSTTVDFEAIAGATDASTNYTWDFGDGNLGSGKNVSHTYNNYGIHMVCAIIENSPNCIKIVWVVVVVAPPSCFDTCFSSFKSESNFTQDNIFDKWNNRTSLQIIPNPISNEGIAIFSEIQSKKATIIINDMNGKMISQSTIPKGTCNYEFNLTGLASGMYMMTLQYPDGKVISSKIIKK